jgi:hypothetical protein
MLSRIAGLAAALLLATVSQAGPMPSRAGEPALAPKVTAQAQVRLPAGSKRLQAVLPAVSEAELETVRAANRGDATKTQARRLAIGIDRGLGAPLATAKQMMWVAVPGGRAAQVAVTSPEAGSLRLVIDLKSAPEDVEMVFFGADATRLEGPIRAGTVRDRSHPWVSPLTEGATQTVEFFVPAGHDAAKTGLQVMAASHVFTTPSSGFTKRLQDIGHSGSCNVDLMCSSLYSSNTFRDAADSVAQLLLRDGTLSYLCSGSLLVDSDDSSQIPWFFSANHCFDNENPPYKSAGEMQTVADTVSTLWKFQANPCGTSNPDPSWSQVSGGATMAYSNPQSDALLFRLNNSPPQGSFFSGWDASTISSGGNAIAVHHPQGDLKKVSVGTVLGFSQPGVGGGNEEFIRIQWNSGTTEGGSSGGGLWTSNNGQYFLRGALWGGTALCSNPSGTDNFSRFDQIYPNLAPYIGPVITPAADYTDLWYGGESQTGWGLNLVQHPSRMVFGVWYTYESDGTRTWFVMPSGTWTSPTTYVGPLYATTGPGYTSAFDPNAVASRQVGNLSISFNSTTTGTFTYNVDGTTGTKSIQRQSF